jgi:heptosyltransferase-2
MKILVIQTASIGDVILSTALLEDLHSLFPPASIDLLVKKGMEGLFTGHPFLNMLILWDKSKKYREMFRILRVVRKSRYDLILNIQRFALTGLITAASGAPKKIGFDKNPFSFLFTDRITHDFKPGMHEVIRNLSLMKPLLTGRNGADGRSFVEGSFQEGSFSTRPKLYPTTADRAGILAYTGKPYVTVAPASLWYTKQYPSVKWIELIAGLPRGIHVFLLGSGKDISLCEAIRQGSGNENASSLAGKLGFLESAALMQGSLMNYTNDSAPMHLASAVNAPVAAVFCSTTPDFGFGPLSDNQTIIQTELNLECRPCGLHGFQQCPRKHFNCAWSIRTDHFPLLYGQ